MTGGSSADRSCRFPRRPFVPHQTGRTDFLGPAFRGAVSPGVRFALSLTEMPRHTSAPGHRPSYPCCRVGRKAAGATTPTAVGRAPARPGGPSRRPITSGRACPRRFARSVFGQGSALRPGAGRFPWETTVVAEMDRRLLGDGIRRCRKAQGLTQERLVEKVGLNPVHMNQIERGDKVPKVNGLLRIARGLRVRLHDLVEDPRSSPPRRKASRGTDSSAHPRTG